MVNNHRNMRPAQVRPVQNQNNCCQRNGEKEKLMRRLQKVDFAINEVNLYLDAYPECRSALDYYHKLKAERETLVNSLSQLGSPVTAFDVTNKERWNWIDSPWPWEFDAN